MNTFWIIDLEHYNTPPFDFQKTLWGRYVTQIWRL